MYVAQSWHCQVNEILTAKWKRPVRHQDTQIASVLNFLIITVLITVLPNVFLFLTSRRSSLR